ncbi:MAG: hypothetical protein OXG19_04095 [Chloroflexi bacterium]|nr:hypothetical protein [Chloroflexota bacterium]
MVSQIALGAGEEEVQIAQVGVVGDDFDDVLPADAGGRGSIASTARASGR